MTQVTTEGAGVSHELLQRIDQIEVDLARVLKGMDATGDSAAPSGGSQLFAVGIGGGTSSEPASGKPTLAALRSSFESKSVDVGPQHFTRSRARFVRGLIRQRRQRERHFPADMFADPAWDMMLDLYAAYYEGGQDVSVSSLCIASAVPATTALRWIKTMTDARLFNRVADPHDGRRIFIRLADGTRSELDKYFDNLES